MSTQDLQGRYGSCLEHGCAHTEDHHRWSRRDFLAGLGLAAGTTVMLGATPIHALARSPLLEALHRRSGERILVLVQLEGGNDGLNTIIPVDDDLYYRARPQLSIPKHVALPLTPSLRLHPSLEPLTNLYNDGQMAIVQGVGYADASLSHFRGTDIWITGTDASSYLNSGWTGRQLEFTYPQFGTKPHDYPLAVQIGGLSSMLLNGQNHTVGMTVSNIQVFERLARTGQFYDTSEVPSSAYGEEMSFVRRVTNDTIRYGAAVQKAAATGANQVNYPRVNQNNLANSLSIVARLIKGNLGARVYHVGLGGFDTHGTQGGVNGRHATLLTYLAEAVRAFLADLGPISDRVLLMTFSEFGRRVEQNGSNGTDHGTAAPLFLFGPGTSGGLLGDTPLLSDLDPHGNLKHGIDFRAVYATVLQHWFGFTASGSESVLGEAFDPLPLIADPAAPTVTRTDSPALPQEITLHQNYPNPFNGVTTISFTLTEASSVTLQVFDVSGRLISTVIDRSQPPGLHEVQFDGSRLTSGTYVYRLRAGRHMLSRQMTFVR